MLHEHFGLIVKELHNYETWEQSPERIQHGTTFNRTKIGVPYEIRDAYEFYKVLEFFRNFLIY